MDSTYLPKKHWMNGDGFILSPKRGTKTSPPSKKLSTTWPRATKASPSINSIAIFAIGTIYASSPYNGSIQNVFSQEAAPLPVHDLDALPTCNNQGVCHEGI